MAGKIFIDYRRGDAPDSTGRLYDRLETEFSAGDLFMDVEGHIKPGDDFVDVLSRQVAQCDVLLAIIGPRWEELLRKRQEEGDDFVAIEIKAALDQEKRVIPVLVGGAGMPRAEILPESMRALARRNAVGLRPERFRADCQGLITALKESLAAAEKERAARTEAERQAVEAARHEAEAQAAARARAAEERGREQAAAGLSANEIRKAEELASWDFVKDRNDVQDLRDHLARFPGGTTERYALTRLEGLIWAGLGPAPTLPQLRAYLDEFPKGANAGAAQARAAVLEREAQAAKAADERGRQETAAWAAASASATPEALKAFLSAWPNGAYAKQARQQVREQTLGPLRRRIAVAVGVAGLLAGVVGAAVSFRSTFREPEMVLVPAGEFTMGSNDYSDEKPPHKVKIAKAFEVGKYEVTFDEWQACVDDSGCTSNKAPDDRGWGRGRRPVINVSWEDAKEYTAWLSRKTGKAYRLLTEAEWEYAARAGTTTKFSFGDDDRELGEHAWFNANSGGRTQVVGQKKANTLGLHDMHGNVWEWVEDCWHDSYKGASADGSTWTTSCTDGSRRVVRGGSWGGSPRDLRSASRIWDSTGGRFNNLGFRVGRTLTP
jgi:formylglycine-generating enzyme required for sulfatase activity